MNEDDTFLRRVIDEKHRIYWVDVGTYWDTNNRERYCVNVRTIGCGCCSDTIQTLDIDLAIEVAKSQIEIWKETVKDLEKEKNTIALGWRTH